MFIIFENISLSSSHKLIKSLAWFTIKPLLIVSQKYHSNYRKTYLFYHLFLF